MKWVDLGMDTQALRLGKGLLIRTSKPGASTVAMVYVSDADSDLDSATWKRLEEEFPAETAFRKPRKVSGEGRWPMGGGGGAGWSHPEGDN